MLIVDLPATATTIAQAQAWLGGTGATIPSSNAAAYFPRMMAADPDMRMMAADRDMGAVGAILTSNGA